MVIICGEQALLISHLSSFSVVEADEAVVGTQFQALSIDNIRKYEDYIDSFKDAQHVVHNGSSKAWGKIIDPPVNKNRDGLGFSVKNNKGEILKPKSAFSKYQGIFHSAGYIHPATSKINDILEDDPGKEILKFVTHGVRVHNYITVIVPSCIHI